jgi:D-beta-D-heptose 7-phosphate kinase/D-beta-D-heptose 1-phosphate adenosyltransferase
MTKVFVNGVFDILHRGHIELLAYAKQQGSYLVVAIDSDQSVKKLKGPTRPINSAQDRKFMLDALSFTDEVHIFQDQEALSNLIKIYSPDIMVKGSDYKDKPIIGAEYCKEIKFYDVVNGYSTTKTIQDIINRR